MVSLSVKVRLLSGQDMWTLPAVPELGVPEPIVMSDGPIGVRGTQWTAGDPSIALPSPTALAATWDVSLAQRVGRLLGQEARRKGVHVLLAPTVNLHRSPYGGRHFEAYSEDPVLSGAIGVAYVRGVQEHGVAAVVKHFVANDSETDRFTVDVRVSERALRELYLAPFETIVREGGAWGVMAAYNAVNGTTMTEHARLQREILKGEWGFDGVIVSDWGAAHDTVAAMVGGLDIAMPAFGSPWGDALVDAVRSGDVPESLVDDAVARVLRLYERVRAKRDLPTVDGVALAREVAARSFVLAVNDGVLPLERGARIALIGALAKDARVMGGGSAQVYPAKTVAPVEAIDAVYAIGADPRTKLPPAPGPFVARFIGTSYEATLPDGEARWMELPDGLMPEAVTLSGRIAASRGGTHELAIRGIGTFSLTAGGRTLFAGTIEPDSGDPAAVFLSPPERRFPLELAAGEEVEVVVRHEVAIPLISFALGHGEPVGTPEELIDEAVAVARAADVAVVVVGTTEEVESEGFDRTTLRLPGRQDELVSRVARVNPRTVVVVNAGSPVELPWVDEVAAVLLTWFPGQEAGNALADVLFGESEPGGRLPTTWPVSASDSPVLSTTPADGVLSYSEDIFIGYLLWQRGDTTPRFAFGHGLGYTTWEYLGLEIEGDSARVTVRNTGVRSGREVVQVYVAPREPDDTRPVRWLAGFAVAEAGPGETVAVAIPLPERAFQVWDSGWRTVPGAYLIEAAHSIDDRRLSASFHPR
ncbi:glycoside hydrolase family 3 C-terminal domain-containing protein [Allorhizocola rhizosphaerae]|uniref:glycoside hydrolase family 3 C-terminal domain-containing protein n=1 Tax=Allorhizocola rhizosphaerae TaxID=1872709 RepID=UPI000E3D1AD8|nr:glycoside hydrolase family 3 C-terminal domain-containing protein [Allorhizocola rhizosphaerae]